MLFLAVKHGCISSYLEIILIDSRMCGSLLPNMQKQMDFCWLELALSSFNCVCSYLQSRYSGFCWYSLGTIDLLKHPEMVLCSVELC